MQIEDFQQQLDERDQEEAEAQKTDQMITLLTEIRDLLKTDSENDEQAQAGSDKLKP